MKIIPSLLLALALLLVPTLAEARAGGGASFGSRGSRTYAAPPATSVMPYSAPIGRSLTPNSGPSPGLGTTPGGYAGVGRSPFAGGFMGGLVGAGLVGLLFGHGLFGGVGGGGSLFGLLLQVVLLVLVGRFVWRAFATRSFSPGGLGSNLGNAFARPAGPSRGPKLALQRADYEAFERLLKDIQAAWSAADLARLRRLATPEMVGVFAEQLAELNRSGLRNIVGDVRLERGDLAESWTEGSRDYATVAMRFSMTDVTRDARGYVVDGSADERVSIAELWTFLRSAGGAPGSAWVLSAIQQAR